MIKRDQKAAGGGKQFGAVADSKPVTFEDGMSRGVLMGIVANPYKEGKFKFVFNVDAKPTPTECSFSCGTRISPALNNLTYAAIGMGALTESDLNNGTYDDRIVTQKLLAMKGDRFKLLLEQDQEAVGYLSYTVNPSSIQPLEDENVSASSESK